MIRRSIRAVCDWLAANDFDRALDQNTRNAAMGGSLMSDEDLKALQQQGDAAMKRLQRRINRDGVTMARRRPQI